MTKFSVLTEEFARAAAEAGWRARQQALASGIPVVFVDPAGRYVEERPDGKRFEVRLDPASRREFHRIIVRELAANLA